MNPFEETIKALHDSNVDYVIVGGFAVVMYGSNRFTPDINIVLKLDPDNCHRAMKTLLEHELIATSGETEKFINETDRVTLYKPEASKKSFFCFKNYEFPFFSVDLFYEPPLPYEELLGHSTLLDFGDYKSRICSMEHLIQMKAEAGRMQDTMDLSNLEAILKISEQDYKNSFDINLMGELPKDIEPERVEDLVEFLKTAPADKMAWLKAMLDALGGSFSF